MFESMINTVFSPITALNPLIAIFIISTILTVAISLVNKKMMGSSKAD
ncbi:MAG: hypothetical protein GW914_03050 [Candidatus Aenigmarchaeota archaeon]|nr:hypothetical protein [Candidatus Aenigmarchaeota archaeon]